MEDEPIPADGHPDKPVEGRSVRPASERRYVLRVLLYVMLIMSGGGMYARDRKDQGIAPVMFVVALAAMAYTDRTPRPGSHIPRSC